MAVPQWLVDLGAISLVSTSVIAAAGALLKNTVKTWLEKRIAAGFDTDLERLKASLREGEERIKAGLRRTEEAVKSDLQTRQADMAALRTMALSGFDKRQEDFEKRRVQAVEAVWDAAVKFRRFHVLAFAMSTDEYSKLSLHYQKTPKAQEFLASITAEDNSEVFNRIDVNWATLYVSETTWGLFEAMHIIIAHAFVKYHAMKSGIKDDIVNTEAASRLLKIALPGDDPTVIDKEAKLGGGLYLARLHMVLINELRRDLRGEHVDQDNLRRANQLYELMGRQSLKEARQKMQE